MNQMPSDVTLLRLAVQNLACSPQAQRRYVQLDMMRRAIGNLDRVGARADELVASGELDAEQAARVSELRSEVLRQMEANADFLEEADAAEREFLFGHALENDGWTRIRQLARPCHTALVGEDSPFLALRAK
jgi:hypothetical protein